MNSYEVYYTKTKQWIVIREEENRYRISIPCRGKNDHVISKSLWEVQDRGGLLTITPAIMCTACGLRIIVAEGQMKNT